MIDTYELMRDLYEKSKKKMAKLQAENKRLKKEIAKLKCLALHAMYQYFYLKAETYSDIELNKYLMHRGLGGKVS